jgi:hypothetical protein
MVGSSICRSSSNRGLILWAWGVGCPLAMACHAPVVAAVECATNVDCADGLICDGTHECVADVSGTLAFSENKSGDPAWKTAGWQLFSAPIGTQSDNFAEALNSWATIWPEHAVLTLGSGQIIFGPKTPHAPPYDGEPAAGVAATDFPHGTYFPERSWTAPGGLLLSGVLIPTAGALTGSSTDFDSGPIVTARVVVTADLYQGQTLVALDPGFTTPTLQDALPDAAFDGWSHVLINFAQSTQFIAGTPGNYAFLVTLLEQDSGAGWTVRVPFVIQ